MADIYIHKNGGGRIIGADGGVSSDSYVDRESIIAGRSFISGASQIVNSIVEDSSLTLVETENAHLTNSQVSQAFIGTSVIDNAIVRGTTQHKADLEDVVLGGEIVVEGAKLRHVRLNGPFLIHCAWDHTPRTFVMTERGLYLGVVECLCRPGVLSAVIGCCCRPISLWIERRELLRRVFQKQGWVGYEIDMFHELFKDWQKNPVL